MHAMNKRNRGRPKGATFTGRKLSASLTAPQDRAIANICKARSISRSYLGREMVQYYLATFINR